MRKYGVSILLLACLLTGGCARDHKVAVQYVPPSDKLLKMDGRGTPFVVMNFKDERPTKDVGVIYSTSYFGLLPDRGPKILAKNDPTLVATEAFASQLTAAGFKVSRVEAVDQMDKTVAKGYLTGSLKLLWSTMKQKFATMDYKSEAVLHLAVVDSATNTTLWTAEVKADDADVFALLGNAKKADRDVSNILSAAINKTLTDPQFQTAIQKMVPADAAQPSINR